MTLSKLMSTTLATQSLLPALPTPPGTHFVTSIQFVCLGPAYDVLRCCDGALSLISALFIIVVILQVVGLVSPLQMLRLAPRLELGKALTIN